MLVASYGNGSAAVVRGRPITLNAELKRPLVNKTENESFLFLYLLFNGCFRTIFINARRLFFVGAVDKINTLILVHIYAVRFE